jgi:hypothetical protein
MESDKVELKENAKYITRGGHVVGPLEYDGYKCWHPADKSVRMDGCIPLWLPNGKNEMFETYKHPEFDIVAKYDA